MQMMSIEEIAETLTICANGKCDYCKFNNNHINYYDCSTSLLRAMAEECRKIGDDLK